MSSKHVECSFHTVRSNRGVLIMTFPPVSLNASHEWGRNGSVSDDHPSSHDMPRCIAVNSKKHSTRQEQVGFHLTEKSGFGIFASARIAKCSENRLVSHRSAWRRLLGKDEGLPSLNMLPLCHPERVEQLH